MNNQAEKSIPVYNGTDNAIGILGEILITVEL